MSISFSWKKLPVDSNGKSYDSLEAFQAAQIEQFIDVGDAEKRGQVAAAIVSNKATVIEILELTTDARPTARGVRKPRKAKQPELPKVQAA